ncbi:DUF5107 domain-containing protein [Paenibacillus lignilyticus]|uniref:DUF5107 domain-containing protein n=1 Tax=Paenibacillus lignilyticus TaxID=1172615 RepID=A0ABS5CI09_9BACL|nr:DUF5107 domain-containing protein [Paenibacillus lignilyticus]MBP3965522.1 DUF5107 domain-containing protein [Paenibacillus lignilyticus]
MLKRVEWREPILVHESQPCGPVPTICDEEGIYPYVSFSETAERPVLRKLRMIAIENDWLKVTVCPDLGGKIHSIIDKASGKEILFHAGSVRPVRILPRMAFISGGIEVSFPIAHTPVQIEAVHAAAEQIGDRLYVWCGEREVRYGMHWTVEYSLGERDRFLTQRTTFTNPTSQAHAWMSWSNAALPARADSQFHFPTGRVLRHADVLEELEWSADRQYRLADFDRMQGFFWKTSDCTAFGMYTPSLGSGLYHIADPAVTPGMKLWLYGTGRHEAWAHQTAQRKESYVEIQAGPLLEQADNNKLQPGARHSHVEFWLPSTEPLDIRAISLPAPQLVELSRVPMFDWVKRDTTLPWLALLSAYDGSGSGVSGACSAPPEPESGCWPPSGMERLGEALHWAGAADADETNRSLWTYYRAVWLAAQDQMDVAIQLLQTLELDCAYALLGRLLRVLKQNYEASRVAYDSIESAAWRLHPQLFIERDLTLEAIGHSTLEERERWFKQVDALQDDGLVERKAAMLVSRGSFVEAKALLESYPFGSIHQRYERTLLWMRIHEALDTPNVEIPEHLGEDDLAIYGAYRVSEANKE